MCVYLNSSHLSCSPYPLLCIVLAPPLPPVRFLSFLLCCFFGPPPASHRIAAQKRDQLRMAALSVLQAPLGTAGGSGVGPLALAHLRAEAFLKARGVNGPFGDEA